MRKSSLWNDDWTFEKQGEVVDISIPHTWNALDGQDGGNDYYRGICIYRKRFNKPEYAKGQLVYVEFRGVNSEAEVWLNDSKLATHAGGYSTFRVNMTKYLKEENELMVVVNNGNNNRVYPQKADFTFYGGIYRDVNLLVLSENHFALNHFGDEGIHVSATLKEETAEIQVKTFVEGQGKIRISLLDEQNKEVDSKDAEGTYCTFSWKQYHLWDGIKDPYQYTAVATLMVDGKAVDEVRTKFGIRSFYVDPDKGFFLNGRSYPLYGVCRHQDRKAIGNAISKDEHVEDMELIREIGANTIRLAHYQHDQYFYDLCDEYGMVVWAEIPYISEHLSAGDENTVSQMEELINQNYNHPSIVCWGVSNEITISTKDKNAMLANHERLNDLCHTLDPNRFTSLACYAMCSPFDKVAHITDTVSWNLYLGWYVPGKFLNDWWMDFFHWEYPKQPLGFSEYGAEGMPNLHSVHPRRGDHTEEYQCIYHEYMLECFKRHPFLWATHVWNMFDFAADARNQGGEPGMNHKGLITFDRKTKKDSFYLYKAYWSKEPFIHIAGKRRADREEDVTTIKVYTNQEEVGLYVDGTLLEVKGGTQVVTFRVPMSDVLEVEVKAGNCVDKARFTKVEKPNPSYKMVKGKKASQNWV